MITTYKLYGEFTKDQLKEMISIDENNYNDKIKNIQANEDMINLHKTFTSNNELHYIVQYETVEFIKIIKDIIRFSDENKKFISKLDHKSLEGLYGTKKNFDSYEFLFNHLKKKPEN